MAVPKYRQDEDKILILVFTEKFARSILCILSLAFFLSLLLALSGSSSVHCYTACVFDI